MNNTGKAKEEENAAYLAAEALKMVPVAPTIGNHDSLNADYAYHFYNPKPTQNGMTEAGGDYYYSYGDGLFIVLNTNNYNVAEHAATIKEAVESDPYATWRVVTIHQDIYGSGLDHSDTDGMILRTQFTPVFDSYDIDVVLQGHDHTYSRSKLLYGDGQVHSGYEFKLNEDGSDYDWDNAYNVASGEKIGLFPEETDTEGVATLTAFREDNNCYTIENTAGNTVTDPKGVLYMSANSASGSKYYELIGTQQDYIAARSQNWLPSWLSRRELFASGIRVGRDMMGTDSNTLILAFAGSSVSMLLLDYSYSLPYLQIINSNNIGIAVMQGLAGSFGVVLSVPITVFAGALLLKDKE